ncbi:PEGA domain-containing protein [Candidatus Saccharibacteria bacterium]|nr:PEGA domain-containing protein [Candidatus Saccharibacteria bacterium]
MMKISKKTRDLITYIVGGTIVFVGTILLVAIAMGWQYNIKTGELEDTGLILLDSEPNNAAISIDNVSINKKTPFRYTNVLPGTYEVAYQLSGYRTWKKQVTVDAEQVSFADYAWLLPNEVPARQRYADRRISNAYQTPNRARFILVETPPASAQPRLLTSTDLTRPPVTLYDPPENPPERRISSIDSVQFSPDNSYILLRLAYSDSTFEWGVISAEPSANPTLLNISKELIIKPSWIGWGPTGNNELYYLENSILRRITRTDKKISENLIENVSQAEWQRDKLITVETSSPVPNAPQPVAKTTKLVLRDNDNFTNPTSLETPLGKQPLRFKYFVLNDNDYLAIFAPEQKDLYLARNLFNRPNERKLSLVGKNISDYSINPTGRFLVYNQADSLVSIDLERTKHYRFKTPLTGLIRWEWINEQHLAYIAKGQLHLVDYDGQNDEVIAGSILSTSPILFSENKSILGFTTPQESTNAAAVPSLTHWFLTPSRAF